jgi:hypothetical protein
MKQYDLDTKPSIPAWTAWVWGHFDVSSLLFIPNIQCQRRMFGMIATKRLEAGYGYLSIARLKKHLKLVEKQTYLDDDENDFTFYLCDFEIRNKMYSLNWSYVDKTGNNVLLIVYVIEISYTRYRV